MRVHGIDPLMAKYAEHIGFARYGKCNNYRYSDVPIGRVSEQYDFVVCSNVLDHTGDWRSFLAHCLRPLKPTGELLLYTHCRYQPSRGHTQVFDPADVLALLLKFGVRDVLHLSVSPDTSEHAYSQCYLRCRAPAKRPLEG